MLDRQLQSVLYWYQELTAEILQLGCKSRIRGNITMESERRYSLEQAQQEGHEVQELTGNPASAELYRLASEIMDMRKQRYERSTLYTKLVPLRCFHDMPEVVDEIGLRLADDESLKQALAQTDGMHESVIQKAITNSFETLSQEINTKIRNAGFFADSAAGHHHRDSNAMLAYEKRLTELGDTQTKMRAFRNNGLRALQERWGKEFDGFGKEDLPDLVQFSLEGMEQERQEAEARFQELPSEQDAEEQRLTKAEAQMRADRVEEKEESRRRSILAKEEAEEARSASLKERQERLVRNIRDTIARAERDEQFSVWSSDRERKTEEQAESDYRAWWQTRTGMRWTQTPFNLLQDDEPLFGEEKIVGKSDQRAELRLNELPWGTRVRDMTKNFSSDPSVEGSVLMAALSDPDSLMRVLRLDQEAEGKYAPNSGFFVRWLTDVGGRPGFGIMHTYGELPEVVVDFKNKGIQFIVWDSIAGRYIGSGGDRIKLMNRRLNRLGWTLDVVGEEMEKGTWGKVTMISEKTDQT